MQPRISASLLAVVWVSLHSAVAFAQSGSIGECETDVLYDSVDGLFVIRQGSDTPLRVYTDFAGPEAGASKPHLSPDRRTLAWVQYIPESGVGPAIWLTDLEDRSSRLLVADMNSDQPAWSPDGTRLVFTSWREGDDGLIGDLYVADVDDGDLTRLTRNNFRDEFATWSPDGHFLVYQVGGLAADNSDWEIYRVWLDERSPQRLTNNTVADAHPDWNTFQTDCRP